MDQHPCQFAIDQRIAVGCWEMTIDLGDDFFASRRIGRTESEEAQLVGSQKFESLSVIEFAPLKTQQAVVDVDLVRRGSLAGQGYGHGDGRLGR